MEEVLWRAVLTRAELEKLRAFVRREDIVETCIGELIYGFGDNIEILGWALILASAEIFLLSRAYSVPCLSSLRYSSSLRNTLMSALYGCGNGLGKMSCLF